jgi:intracellular multiplication protein IcmP
MNNKSSNFNDATIELLVIFVGMMVLLYVGYWFAEEQIKDVLITLFQINLKVLLFIANIPYVGDSLVQVFLPHATAKELQEILNIAYLRQGYELTTEDQLNYIEVLSTTLRPLLIPLIILQLIRHYRFQRVRWFKKKYNIHTLAQKSKKYLPHLIPPLAVDLLALDPDKGQLARAKPPLRYAIENKLIKVYDLDLKNQIDTSKKLTPTFSKIKGKLPNYLYIKEKIDDINGQKTLFKRCVFVPDSELKNHFDKQLGKKLTSVYKMAKTRRLVLAMALLMAKGYSAGGVTKAYALNRAINKSFKLKGKILGDGFKAYVTDKGVNKIIRDNIDHPLFQKALEMSAYELTFMVRTILIARQYGKFFTSHNYWIKYFDRPLWFTFHQTGSDTYWTETSSVQSHYFWEEKCKLAIDKPCTGNAIKGFKLFLTETENWIYKKGYEVE